MWLAKKKTLSEKCVDTANNVEKNSKKMFRNRWLPLIFYNLNAVSLGWQ
jgi:hypothetical protein